MSTLVLLRHGESMWNKKNVFTGWVDVPLSEKGIDEAQKAGYSISEIPFDVIFTSTLVRSIETAMIALAVNKNDKVPIIVHENEDKISKWSTIYNESIIKETISVFQDWHLNERYYGKLQGKNKEETASVYGQEQVLLWRRSFDVPPPEGEALKDTAERTIPFFKEKIIPFLMNDQNVLISAHGNSLRSIVMHLDGLNREEVINLELGTGVPIIYEYENGKVTRKK